LEREMALIMMRSVATTRRGFFKLKRSYSGIRAFSSLLTSPPSKAVVYERHGPPDAVTRYVCMFVWYI
jgi:trans-2-enoyl-CoA reductase